MQPGTAHELALELIAVAREAKSDYADERNSSGSLTGRVGTCTKAISTIWANRALPPVRGAFYPPFLDNIEIRGA